MPPPLQNPCEASSFSLPSFDAGSWQSPCETSDSTADFNPSAGLPRSSFGDVNAPSVVVGSSDEETELLAPLKEEQFDPRFSRCFGPPITCRHDTKHPEFNDGFGLCSPGRWRPQAREKLASPAEREHSFRIREILSHVVRSEIGEPRTQALRLATGRIKASPFSADALHKARQVFRPRLKQRQLDVTPFEPIMQNYASAEISSEQLEQQFRSDEQKGMMVCTTEAECVRRRWSADSGNGGRR